MQWHAALLRHHEVRRRHAVLELAVGNIDVGFLASVSKLRQNHIHVLFIDVLQQEGTKRAHVLQPFLMKELQYLFVVLCSARVNFTILCRKLLFAYRRAYHQSRLHDTETATKVRFLVAGPHNFIVSPLHQRLPRSPSAPSSQHALHKCRG